MYVKCFGHLNDLVQVGVLQCLFCLSSKHVLCSCQDFKDFIPALDTPHAQGSIFLNLDQSSDSGAFRDEPSFSTSSCFKKHLHDNVGEECQSVVKFEFVGLRDGLDNHDIKGRTQPPMEAAYMAHTDSYDGVPWNQDHGASECKDKGNGIILKQVGVHIKEAQHPGCTGNQNMMVQSEGW